MEKEVNSKLPLRVQKKVLELREQENTLNKQLTDIDRKIQWLKNQKIPLAKRVSSTMVYRQQIVKDNLEFPLVNRDLYDDRKLPRFEFAEDFTLNNSVLYLKGEEYDVYNWNFSRLVNLLRANTIKICL